VTLANVRRGAAPAASDAPEGGARRRGPAATRALSAPVHIPFTHLHGVFVNLLVVHLAVLRDRRLQLSHLLADGVRQRGSVNGRRWTQQRAGL
jgi:hypothetical protein